MKRWLIETAQREINNLKITLVTCVHPDGDKQSLNKPSSVIFNREFQNRHILKDFLDLYV